MADLVFSFLRPPTVGVRRCNCVFPREGWRRKRERCYPHSREPAVCKAVSLDIASAEERVFPFFHSLRYTLINLLKAATPVSSSLTHLKRQTALKPTRIFSMDASKGGKKKQSSPATDSSLSPGLKMKLKGRQALAPPDGRWAERQLLAAMEPLEPSLCASAAHQTTAASFSTQMEQFMARWVLSAFPEARPSVRSSL